MACPRRRRRQERKAPLMGASHLLSCSGTRLEPSSLCVFVLLGSAESSTSSLQLVEAELSYSAPAFTGPHRPPSWHTRSCSAVCYS